MENNTKTGGDGSEKASEKVAQKPWRPTVGKDVVVMVQMFGGYLTRARGVCTAVRANGRIDADVVLPTGARTIMPEVAPAELNHLGLGYVEP